MPGWGEILNEISRAAADGPPDVDSVRRHYLEHLASVTGRPVVVYASDFLVKGGPQTSINLQDMQGLMEVFKGLTGDNLDLILHSPGGQAEATERLVTYMRSKFSHVRVFVPLAAMSAATMWAMAADEIIMGKHSQLGPIDPQVTLPSGVTVPAGALIDQFKEANDQCVDEPKRITGWLPTLQQYPPGLLNVCESSDALSKQLVAQWLEEFMFRNAPDGAAKAADIAEWLGNDKIHLSHSRPLTREQLAGHGIVIRNLEEDPQIQDAVLSVHHSVMHTFGMTATVKLVENNRGRAWIQQGGVQLLQAPPANQPPHFAQP